MVATDEIMSETEAAGKTARPRGTSVASASLVKFTDQGSMTTDHKFGNSGDMLPDTPIPRHRDLDSCLDADHCPLGFERYARNRSYDLTLANVLRQEPKSRYSRSKESGLRQGPKSSRRGAC